MAGSPDVLRFAWWNVQSFAHYDDTRAGEEHWPLMPEAYQAKCDRVDRVLHEAFATGPPEVMAFAELTNQAAIELRNRLFPDHAVMSLDSDARAALQVAFIYRRVDQFE